MNHWRWLGISLFLLGAVCLIGTTKLPGQDKKTTPAATTTSPAKTTPEAKASTTVEPKKATTTVEPKKKEDDTKKAVPPPTEVKPGDTLLFKGFEPKQKWYQLQKTVTKQKMTVNNQPIDQNQEQTFLIEWEAKDKKDGNYVVIQKIIGIDMSINIGGNKIAYDSRAKNPKNPMTDFFEQLTKSTLEYTISSNLEVKSVVGADAFIKGLSDINPQMQGLLKNVLSDKALEKMAEPTWWAFPKDGKLPAKGQSWEKNSELNLGPIGIYKTKFVFTTKDAQKDTDVIGIKSTLEYTAPSEKQGLPFVITKAELKSDAGEGEAVFDRAKGRFASSKIDMKLNGKLWIEVSNMTTEVTLEQSQTATSSTSDTIPADWVPKK